MKQQASYLVSGFLLLLAAASTHAQPGWSVAAAPYQYSMTAVAQIQIDDIPAHQTGNQLAVFSKGQIRGYATPVLFAGQAYYFLNLYSNIYKDDTLYFRAFIGADQKVYESVDTVVFRHHLALGNMVEPFQIHLQLGDRPLIYTLSEVNYAENSCPEVLDVQATDKQDSEGAGLTYSIVGGADAGRFSIQPQTGLLIWLNFSPNFAMPEDANGDNRYELELQVTDLANLFDLQKITVTVVPEAPVPPLVCPPNLERATSDDGTGDCGTVTSQTAVALTNACAENSLSYQLSGATSGSGDGLVPANQVFAKGLTTVVYIQTLGNGSECAFTVTVQDDEPPALSCPDNQTVAPTENNPCAAVVNGIDASFGDNCSGSTLAYLFSGATSGSGSGHASGQTFLLGTTTVTYTVIDGSDHSTSCMFTVAVTDCALEFSGTIKWEHDGTSGVNNTTVSLTGAGTGSFLTGTNGDYLISIAPTTGDFTLKPVKNSNKLNGVTSADVTAIQLHVANSAPLPAPFKRIAADVNKSNSITTLDATLLNQALLGNPAALNQITSWRFVPEGYVFPNPNAPWSFPEQINLTGVSTNQSGQNFKGIKLGDVAATWADPINFGAGEPLVFHLSDRWLQQGETAEAEFRADDLDDLTSFQFALRFDPEYLLLEALEPLDGLSDVSTDDFGLYNLAEGEIRMVWVQTQGQPVEAAAPVFRLKFRVLGSGRKLSDVLQLENSILPAYAYNSAFAESAVLLKYSETTGTKQAHLGAAVVLFQNQPNPFSAETLVSFVLPDACVVQLRIFDLAGRELLYLKNAYPAGYNFEKLRLDALTASGVLFYELTTPFGVLTKRMMRVGK